MDDVEDDDEESLKKKADEKLGKFFLGCGISFRTVDSTLFSDFLTSVQLCAKHYKPPCRRTLAGPILQRILKEVHEDRKKLLDGTDAVLMIDGWKNKVTNKKHTVCTLKNARTPQILLYCEEQ